MMEIKVTIEAAELSAAISKLAEALSGSVILAPEGVRVNVQPAAAEVKQEPAQQTQQTQAQTPEATAAETSAATTAAPAAVSLEAVSRAGAALIDAGKMMDVLKLLQDKYRVSAVTQLKPDQLPAFAVDLRALGADI